jgi:type III restriction enzyme
MVVGDRLGLTDAAMNLKHYEPDFVAVDAAGVHWLLETKGQETVDVLRKDVAAIGWCENATELSGNEWRYVKVPQKDFQTLQPVRSADLMAFQPVTLA